MSKNYDNWERLVTVVLRRLRDIELAMCHSRDSSIISDISSVDLNFDAITTTENLPTFREVIPSEWKNLFLRKVNICCFQFDFTDNLRSVGEKEIKRQTLLELVDFIQSGRAEIDESNQENLIRMISVNIFRCFPPASYKNTGGGGSKNVEAEEEEEEDIYLDPSWPHLQLVYELLLRYVESPNTHRAVAKRYIDNSFVLNLLDLFDSEDPREREYLKTILHRTYGKFTMRRVFIRKAVNNVFYTFVYETGRHNGIRELLEIVGSIIPGFMLPVKEEHKLFLARALIPLHKPKAIEMYHPHLSYCVMQFVQKDHKLADMVIRGLLKYWPVTNSQDEVLFLDELEEVLEAMRNEEFQQCVVPLFRQIARCINSSHYQVAEHALQLWNNDRVHNLITQNRNIILPIIFEALETSMLSHWNQAVQDLSFIVRRMFLEMDKELFEECQRQHIESGTRSRMSVEERDLLWQRLEAAAWGG